MLQIQLSHQQVTKVHLILEVWQYSFVTLWPGALFTEWDYHNLDYDQGMD